MPVPVTGEHAIANRRLLRDDVFDRLLEAIVAGTLEPGERLRDEELASWLGVSRTPIREAITRLVDMGLVEMEPNRYTRVSEVDPSRFLDAQLVAASLYRVAVRLAMPRFSDLELAEIQDILDHASSTTDSGGGIESLTDLWKVITIIAERTENAPLIRIINDLGPDIRRISIPTWSHVHLDYLHDFLSTFGSAMQARDAEAAGHHLEEASLRFGEQMAGAARLVWPVSASRDSG